MLTYDEATFGIQHCALNLEKLYPNLIERSKFFSRYAEFRNSDLNNQCIYSLRGNVLHYRSEIFVPDKIDQRPPLLLILGNPASHSIINRMCFAFEGNGKEHRFWRSLQSAGILTFQDLSINNNDSSMINQIKRDSLLQLNYVSPFRIGIAVFYSLPSSASNRKWSGVSGIRALLGSRAFETISLLEEERIDEMVSRFISSVGGIIAFQKDVFNRLRSQDTCNYSKDSANLGSLKGKYKKSQSIFLAGAPPTRMALSAPGKSAMLTYKHWLIQKLMLNS